MRKHECDGQQTDTMYQNVDGYKSQLASQQEKLAIENRCIGMGASGQNKNLCMEDPDAYAAKKSECESMDAKDNDLNKCIRNIENYRSDYQIAQRAKELGVSERNAKKIMKNEEQIKKLQESLGQV